MLVNLFDDLLSSFPRQHRITIGFFSGSIKHLRYHRGGGGSYLGCQRVPVGRETVESLIENENRVCCGIYVCGKENQSVLINVLNMT